MASRTGHPALVDILFAEDDDALTGAKRYARSMTRPAAPVGCSASRRTTCGPSTPTRYCRSTARSSTPRPGRCAVDLEALHAYGKYLRARLPCVDTGGAVDLDGAVVLTHLRTDLIAEQENASLSEWSEEPLTGTGEGRGKQHEQPTDSLSALIAALNERFGMNLDEADRIWFEPQEAHLRADDDVKVVALNNDFEQFKVFLEPRLQDGMIDRQEQNGMLFQAFFDKPEFREAMQAWLTERLYRGIREA